MLSLDDKQTKLLEIFIFQFFNFDLSFQRQPSYFGLITSEQRMSFNVLFFNLVVLYSFGDAEMPLFHRKFFWQTLQQFFYCSMAASSMRKRSLAQAFFTLRSSSGSRANSERVVSGAARRFFFSGIKVFTVVEENALLCNHAKRKCFVPL